MGSKINLMRPGDRLFLRSTPSVLHEGNERVAVIVMDTDGTWDALTCLPRRWHASYPIFRPGTGYLKGYVLE